MKLHLLIACLIVSLSLAAQSYTRDWRSCYDNGRVLEPRPTLQASAIDAAGNLYVAGFVNLKHDPINDSVYLKKYSADGTVLWEIYEPFRSAESWSGPTPLAMITDKSGNIILGYSYSFVSSNMDAVINKYNSLGKRLWQTIFDGPETVDNEQVKKLNIDDNGNIYLLMAETSQDYFDYGTIARFNSQGSLLWYRDMKGILVNNYNNGYAVTDATIDSIGNVYATGYSNSVPKGERYNVFTYKFLANGDSSWRNRYLSNGWTFGYRVMYAAKDNSVVICGHSGYGAPDSIIAVKYTAGAGGKQRWAYAGRPVLSQTFNQSVIDADNNILIASRQTLGGIDYHAPYLTKLSPSGTLLWAKYASDDLYYQEPFIALDLKTDGFSNYYMTTSQPRGILVQKFDKKGRLLAQATEGIDTSGSVYYSGLNISADQSIYTATEYGFYFARATKCVSKYSLKNAVAATSVINGDMTKPSITSYQNLVYPNPAHNVIHIALPVAITSRCTVSIVNGLGKLVLTKSLSGPQTVIDISKLSAGVYIMKINGDAKQPAYRFIKQ